VHLIGRRRAGRTVRKRIKVGISIQHETMTAMYLKTHGKGKGKHNTKNGRRPKPHGLRTKDQTERRGGGGGTTGEELTKNEN